MKKKNSKRKIKDILQQEFIDICNKTFPKYNNCMRCKLTDQQCSYLKRKFEEQKIKNEEIDI